MLTLLFAILGVLLAFVFGFAFTETGGLAQIMKIQFVVLSLLYTMVLIYTVALQAQFSNTVVNTLKNAAILSVKNLIMSLLIINIHLIPVICMLYNWDLFYKLLPLWTCFAPAGITLACAFLFKKIFTPLIEIDKEQNEERKVDSL